MKSISLRVVALLLLALSPLASVAKDYDCDQAPLGEGGDWARDYMKWCEWCGGTYDKQTQSCAAGDHWRGAPKPNPAANAARRRAAEERRQRDEEEWQAEQERAAQQQQQEQQSKQRAAEYARRREEAQRRIKGISENELGIRGAGGDLKPKGDTQGALPIREPLKAPGKPACQWGDQPPSVVDLRCLGLDPKRPIAVDPHVVRGKERVFPAQIDPETFSNADYNQGFAALMRFDVASAAEAITRFEAARKARPNDPLVRNALLLARDIHRGRVEKEKSDRREAAFLNLQSYAALMSGDERSAGEFAARAVKLDPANANSRFLESLARTAADPSGVGPARHDAYRLVGNALYSLRKSEPRAAAASLDAARRLEPSDAFIGALRDQVNGLLNH